MCIKSKKKKIALVKELMEKLGVTSQEMILALREDEVKPCPKNKLIKGVNVCVGMFWYYDNTFSFDLIPHKVVKAVVEYIDDEYIYGDLTASPAIGETLCSFNKNETHNTFCIDEFIRGIPYTCDDNEEIVCYSYRQTEQVSIFYDVVKDALKKIGKNPRKDDGDAVYWTFDTDGHFHRVFSFGGKNYDEHWTSKLNSAWYRPVLRLKID